MSLFNSQTIFSLFITLLIGFALYYYIKYKYRVLELTQREQAKVLQSVIMAMNNNNQNIMNIVQNRSQEEVVSDAVNESINRFRQVNSNNELIDVSDDSGSESSDDSDESSESSESSESESECDSECSVESDQGDEQVEEQEVSDNTTRKILFTGNNDSRVVEHLDGPDVKVIELTHPLYPKNGGEEYKDGDDDDDEDDGDDDEDSDSESISSDLDGPHEPSVRHEKVEVHEVHEVHEIKENVVISEINNNNNQIHLETDNSLDNISVKAVFKTKDSETHSETHSDYNSMNVQSLRQHLRNKLSSEGSLMSEASINKLTKRDLIKHLS